MKSQAWKIAGLALALSGSVAMAQTESETNAPPEMKGTKPNPEMRGRKPGPEMKRRKPAPEEVFKRFDADGDGSLSETERQAMDEVMLKRRERQGGPQGRRPGREEMMKRFDTDGDGVLSEAEREAMRTERERMRAENMKRFDTDGDGRLSEAERKTMHETLRDERPAPPPEEGEDL